MESSLLVGESDSRGHPFPLPCSPQHEKMQPYPTWISSSFLKSLSLYGKSMFHALQRPLLWHNNHCDVLGVCSRYKHRASFSFLVTDALLALSCNSNGCIPSGFQVVSGDQHAYRLHCSHYHPVRLTFCRLLQFESQNVNIMPPWSMLKLTTACVLYSFRDTNFTFSSQKILVFEDAVGRKPILPK